ncbi:hypothetical protein J3E69DRAFT_345444 [Trichoderma sp. SZMC 28015]
MCPCGSHLSFYDATCRACFYKVAGCFSSLPSPSLPSHPSPITPHTLAAGKSSPQNRPGPSLAPASLDKSPLLLLLLSKYTCYSPVPVDSLSPPPQISSRARPTPSKMEMALLHLLPGSLVGERWRKAHQWIPSSTYAGRTMMPHEQSIHACMYSYVCTFFHRLFLYYSLPCWAFPLSLNPSAAICYSTCNCVLIQCSMPAHACGADTGLNFQLRRGLACHQKDRSHQKLGEYEK